MVAKDRSTNNDQTIQLNKMLKFMEHETEDMVMNLDNMAENEYNTLKNKLIFKSKIEIDQLYKKRIKSIQRKKATMISTLMTRAKLQILHSRDKHIKSVLAEVNEELIKVRDNKILYKEVLKKLILQAMYQVLEDEVNLIIISEDLEFVESMTDELEHTFKAHTGMNVKINIENHNLSVQDIGGVILTAKNRRILVENTLVTRLIHIALQYIPIICCGLFGPNPTRTHSNIVKQ